MNYIFWDFNGTILDDAKLCFTILNEMLVEENRPTVSFEEYLMIFTFPIEAYYDQVFDLKKSSFKDLAHKFINRYQPRSLSLPLHDHVIDTIKYFESMGYTNILLSASEETNLHEQLNHYNIKHLFKHILGTSNVYAKSKIQVGKDFIEKMKIDTKNAVMIGDTLHDAEVAKELKMDIILFTKGHQHKERLKNYKNIDSFHELIGKI
jgi:phosphoglycolate phosphatase